MKLTNVILILIAILLMLVLLRLDNCDNLILSVKESSESLAATQRSLMSSNQRLENEIVFLRDTIKELETRLLKK